MLGAAHIERDNSRTCARLKTAVRGPESAAQPHAACDFATRRVGEALAREADLVDEGVGVAGEALGALVVEQLAVVALRLRLLFDGLLLGLLLGAHLDGRRGVARSHRT